MSLQIEVRDLNNTYNAKVVNHPTRASCTASASGAAIRCAAKHFKVTPDRVKVNFPTSAPGLYTFTAELLGAV